MSGDSQTSERTCRTVASQFLYASPNQNRPSPKGHLPPCLRSILTVSVSWEGKFARFTCASPFPALLDLLDRLRSSLRRYRCTTYELARKIQVESEEDGESRSKKGNNNNNNNKQAQESPR